MPDFTIDKQVSTDVTAYYFILSMLSKLVLYLNYYILLLLIFAGHHYYN